MSSSWTEWQNDLFEKALVRYDKDTPDRWQNVARAVGCGKSAEDVKRHFAELYQDLGDIEAGDLRQFGGSGSGNTKGASSSGGSSKERRSLSSDRSGQVQEGAGLTALENS